MSPDAFKMRKMNTTIAATTNRPTRNSRIPGVFFCGIVQNQEKGLNRTQAAPFTPSFLLNLDTSLNERCAIAER